MVPGTPADLAEADWVSDELRNKPHVTLGCGHLSRPGNGPLAEAGYGYCRYHGVTRTGRCAAGRVPPGEGAGQ
jgi:hypothetical protein